MEQGREPGRETKRDLIRVAASQDAMLNGVAVSPEGRVFSSFPRWAPGATPSLAEVMPDGTFRPFPGDDWNHWEPGLPHENRIVSTHAVHCDRWNRLWVIDDATPRTSPAIPGAAKIIQFDLETHRATRVYRFDEAFLEKGSVLGHMRVDGHHAYISESHHYPSLIVLDLASGKARKRLPGHALMMTDPDIVPVIQGREFRTRDGVVPRVHVDLLELSPDGRWLYFAALLGPMLRRVETRLLADEQLSDEELVRHIEDVRPVKPLAGLAADAAGNLYICSITEDAILRLSTDGRLEKLISDPRISFPNEGAVGPDGFFYFPGSQIHRTARFGDGRSVVERPFEVLKIRL
jgi:sugar lactone lactonase YvrE